MKYTPTWKDILTANERTIAFQNALEGENGLGPVQQALIRNLSKHLEAQFPDSIHVGEQSSLEMLACLGIFLVEQEQRERVREAERIARKKKRAPQLLMTFDEFLEKHNEVKRDS